jgi:hypothetical protein
VVRALRSFPRDQYLATCGLTAMLALCLNYVENDLPKTRALLAEQGQSHAALAGVRRRGGEGGCVCVVDTMMRVRFV